MSKKGYAKLSNVNDRSNLYLDSVNQTNNNPVGAQIISLPEYLSQIPDEGIRQFISRVSKAKLSETYAVLDWYTKAIWYLSNNVSNFVPNLSRIIQTDKNIEKKFSEMFTTSSTNEMLGFKKLINSYDLLKNFNKKFEDEIKFEAEFTKKKNLQDKLKDLEDLCDYNHHVIMSKLKVRKFTPAPVVQNLSEVVQILKFDSLHNEAVNCIDICPHVKLLASASSDGTIKFIDLETMKSIPEITINVPGHKKVHSVALDDKNNVAFVTDDNTLYIFSIERMICIASYKGEKLSGFSTRIPNQCVQFTSDFYYIGFRKASDSVILFDMPSRQIAKEFKCSDQIEDYSFSPQTSAVAFAIYSECSIEIHDMQSGTLVCKQEYDSKFYFLN